MKLVKFEFNLKIIENCDQINISKYISSKSLTNIDYYKLILRDTVVIFITGKQKVVVILHPTIKPSNYYV